MKLYLHEIIQRAANAETFSDKVRILQTYNTIGLRDILKITYDKNVKWSIPQTDVPPYEACEDYNWATNLMNRTKMLTNCIEPKGSQIKSMMKKENFFIGLLETIHPKDAEMLVNNTLPQKPFDGIGRDVVIEAFPKLSIPAESPTQSVDFETMDKVELLDWAANELNLTIDRRKSKANIIKEIKMYK